jgi:hypothetical protein
VEKKMANQDLSLPAPNLHEEAFHQPYIQPQLILRRHKNRERRKRERREGREATKWSATPLFPFFFAFATHIHLILFYFIFCFIFYYYIFAT